MKKKLQIFVSSTYVDLIEERQAAVEAILGSKHIPAGMELFTAGNESQLTTIKKWIDESDIYMLILGGRYGSTEEKSGKSYTQIEYEYAVSKSIPVFAVVLSEAFLHKKQASNTKDEIFEREHTKEYEKFKKLVMTKIIKEVDDCKDIKIAIKDTISDFLEDYELTGWVKGSNEDISNDLIKENKELTKESLKLFKENQKLKEQITKQKNDMIGDFTIDEIKKVLKEKMIDIPKDIFGEDEMSSINAFDLFISLYDAYCTGVTNRAGQSEASKRRNRYLYFDFAPLYMAYGLLEKVKVSGVTWERIQTSKDGRKFYGICQLKYS